jgi:hypothetical protein
MWNKVFCRTEKTSHTGYPKDRIQPIVGKIQILPEQGPAVLVDEAQAVLFI